VVTAPDVVTPRSRPPIAAARVSKRPPSSRSAPLVTVMEGYNLIVYGAVVPLLLVDPGLGIGPSTAGVVGSPGLRRHAGRRAERGACSATGSAASRYSRCRSACFLLGAVCAALGRRARFGLGRGATTGRARRRRARSARRSRWPRDHAPRQPLQPDRHHHHGRHPGRRHPGRAAGHVHPAALSAGRPMFVVGAVLTGLILLVVLAGAAGRAAERAGRRPPRLAGRPVHPPPGARRAAHHLRPPRRTCSPGSA